MTNVKAKTNLPVSESTFFLTKFIFGSFKNPISKIVCVLPFKGFSEEKNTLSKDSKKVKKERHQKTAAEEVGIAEYSFTLMLGRLKDERATPCYGHSLDCFKFRFIRKLIHINNREQNNYKAACGLQCTGNYNFLLRKSRKHNIKESDYWRHGARSPDITATERPPEKLRF